MRSIRSALCGGVAAVALAGCAGPSPGGPPAAGASPETVWALTAAGELWKFRAAAPGQPLEHRPLQGLAAGERLVGIDFRVAQGRLYGVASTGALYEIDPARALARRVGPAASAVPLRGERFGVDFNPTVDRLRLVSDAGLNLRLHPDTGEVVDGDAVRPGVQADAPLAFAAAGAPGAAPQVVAAAYTYNTRDPKLTTNYAIEAREGWLVIQGSREGEQPVISPNTGQLRPVGPLGTGALDDAAFDIADASNRAYAALTQRGRTGWYAIDLVSGRASRLGDFPRGVRIVGVAIEP